MGFGWNTRSPEDVQRYNGRAYTFETIAERYESIKPIAGKRRGHLNIRPHADRRRCWERIIKVSDSEYYLTNDAYRWSDLNTQWARPHNRAITFKRDESGLETIIVHTPRVTWGEKPMENFYPRALSVPSTFWFYHYNLPSGLDLTKHKSKVYLKVASEGGCNYYTLAKGDVVLTKTAEGKWNPLVVHREEKRIIDRKQTNEIRSYIKDFVEYSRVVMPLVDISDARHWWGGNPFDIGNNADTELKAFLRDKTWQELLTKGDEVPEHWFEIVKYYKKLSTKEAWVWEEKKYITIEATPESIKTKMFNDIIRKAKPFKTVEVPLGEPVYDRYANW